jgi:protein deglycase
MKSAVVVLADGFEEIEAVTPVDLLRRAGVTVTVAGLSGLTAVGARGIAVVCDCLLEQAPVWDVLVLPGGLPGARQLAASSLVDQSIAETLNRGAWVAAICAAPALVLGSRGYLRGKAFTGYPGTGTEADLAGSSYREDPVVVDGLLVTSRGVGTAGAFGLKLVELLAGPEKALEVARAVLLA